MWAFTFTPPSWPGGSFLHLSIILLTAHPHISLTGAPYWPHGGSTLLENHTGHSAPLHNMLSTPRCKYQMGKYFMHQSMSIVFFRWGGGGGVDCSHIKEIVKEPNVCPSPHQCLYHTPLLNNFMLICMWTISQTFPWTMLMILTFYFSRVSLSWVLNCSLVNHLVVIPNYV